MGMISKLFHSCDKPTNYYDSTSTAFSLEGQEQEHVTDRTDIQHVTVYVCVNENSFGAYIESLLLQADP